MIKNRCRSNNLPYIFQNVTFSSCFDILWDFCKKIILLFWLYWITSFLFQSKFAEDFRFIILDRIKRVLFGGNFSLGLLKILLQNLFFYTKKLCYRSYFTSFFWGKNSKWTNSYQNSYTQHFINAAKSLIREKMQKKCDGKVT